jgi:hypothetical protein
MTSWNAASPKSAFDLSLYLTFTIPFEYSQCVAEDRAQPGGNEGQRASCLFAARQSLGGQRFSRLKMKRGKWRTTNMISAHWAGA